MKVRHRMGEKARQQLVSQSTWDSIRFRGDCEIADCANAFRQLPRLAPYRMNPANSLQFSANRFWNAAIERFSRAPGGRFGVADGYCLLGILASFAAGLAVSWQRWGNPLVDSGREL